MGKSRNHIVVPRPPATQRAAVDSLVRAPPGGGCAPLGPPRPSTPTVKGSLAVGIHGEAAPPEPGAPRSGLRGAAAAVCDFLSGSSSRLGRLAPLPASPGSAVSSSLHRRPVHRDRKPHLVSSGGPEPRPRPPRPRSPPAAPARPCRRRRLGPATSPPSRGPTRTARAGPGAHPGQGEVGHELLEGPRLLGLPLRVQRDLLTELPRVGAARAGRGGHGARPALAG